MIKQQNSINETNDIMLCIVWLRVQLLLKEKSKYNSEARDEIASIFMDSTEAGINFEEPDFLDFSKQLKCCSSEHSATIAGMNERLRVLKKEVNCTPLEEEFWVQALTSLKNSSDPKDAEWIKALYDKIVTIDTLLERFETEKGFPADKQSAIRLQEQLYGEVTTGFRPNNYSRK